MSRGEPQVDLEPEDSVQVDVLIDVMKFVDVGLSLQAAKRCDSDTF